jgi:ABC-type transport system substrate-binding protein
VLTSYTGELASQSGSPPDAAGPRPEGGRLVVHFGNAHVDALPTRRVYFLAVNHAYTPLGGADGPELRRLIAHAIQRDAILNACFRAGFTDYHRPLDGPFPPGTWPCSPLASRLDDADLARSLAGRRKAPPPLDLKYPAGDPAVENACRMIQQQLADAKVTVKLTPLEPAELFKKVVVEKDFHLAYWHYDYPDEWFSPAGLLDPKAGGLGNRNFMGYQPSAEFATLLAGCQNRRDFGAIRKSMQQLHAAFRTELPFIPLWHLDTHVLAAADLRVAPSVTLLDPLAPFAQVEHWTLAGR